MSDIPDFFNRVSKEGFTVNDVTPFLPSVDYVFNDEGFLESYDVKFNQGYYFNRTSSSQVQDKENQQILEMDKTYSLPLEHEIEYFVEVVVDANSFLVTKATFTGVSGEGQGGEGTSASDDLVTDFPHILFSSDVVTEFTGYFPILKLKNGALEEYTQRSNIQLSDRQFKQLGTHVAGKVALPLVEDGHKSETSPVKVRAVVAGSGIHVSQTDSSIVIAATGTGEGGVGTGACVNIGSAVEVYNDGASTLDPQEGFEFRTLIGSESASDQNNVEVSIDPRNADRILISGGHATHEDGSAGNQVYIEDTIKPFKFRGLVAGTHITIGSTNGGADLEISSDCCDLDGTLAAGSSSSRTLGVAGAVVGSNYFDDTVADDNFHVEGQVGVGVPPSEIGSYSDKVVICGSARIKDGSDNTQGHLYLGNSTSPTLKKETETVSFGNDIQVIDFTYPAGAISLNPYGATSISHQTDLGGYEMQYQSPATGSAILGGSGNAISGNYNVIIAGIRNQISGGNTNVIGGGSGVNVDNSEFSVSVGGRNNDISGSDFAVIGGGFNNLISGSERASIAGGSTNKITDAFAANIGGGQGNLVSNKASAIAGGESNVIKQQLIDGGYNFIGAGVSNTISGLQSTIAGGNNNTISGRRSTILGGAYQNIGANDAVTAGNYSIVQPSHHGAFVFSDSLTTPAFSTGANTMVLDFKSGVFIETDSGIYVNGNPVVTGTSAFETDTLQTVTDEGNTTTNDITVADLLVQNNGQVRANGAGSLTLGNTNGGTIYVSGHGGASVITPRVNHLYLQSNRDEDDIIFQAGEAGVEMARFDSENQRFGIGVATPQSRLHVGNATGNNLGLIFTNPTETVRQYFVDDSADSDFFITYDGNGGAEITLQHDGKLVLNASNGDNVGIGSINPQANLDVTSTLNQQHLKVQGAYAEGVGALAIIKTTANGNALLVESASTSDSREIFEVKNGGGPVFDILGDGNVGIAVADPDEKLEVDGNIKIASDRFYRMGGSDFQIGADGAAAGMHFHAGGTEKLTLLANGNFAIGANSPAHKLVVSGDAAGTGHLGQLTFLTTGYLLSGQVSVADFIGSSIVNESEGIGNNDNDDTIPTSAAVKDYVDNTVIPDTNTFVNAASFNTSDGVLTLTRNDSVTVTTDLDGRFALSSSLGTAATQNVGISENNVLQVDSTVSDNDFLRIDGTKVQGLNDGETRTALGLGTAAVQNVGIGNSNLLQSDGTISDEDFLRVDGTHIKGLDAGETRTALGLGAAALLGVGVSANDVLQADETLNNNDFLQINANKVKGLDASEARSALGLGSLATLSAVDADTVTVSNLEKDNLKASFLVIESEGIGNNDNDDTIPTSAAVKDYVDNTVIPDTNTFVNAASFNTSNGVLTLTRNDAATVTTDLDGRFALSSSLGTAALENVGIGVSNLLQSNGTISDNDFLRVDGTKIEGLDASEVLSAIGAQASLTFGIADTNAVKIDSSSVADDEYARFTANGLESRSTAEVLSDIGAQSALSFGISAGDVTKVGAGGLSDNDFVRVDGTTYEGLDASEVRSALSLGSLATLSAIDGDVTVVSNLSLGIFKANAIVTEAEGIGSNDTDTMLPTSAAVKDYVDNTVIPDTNTFVNAASFNTSDGVLTLTRNDSVTVTTDLDGRFALSSSLGTAATENVGTSEDHVLQADSTVSNNDFLRVNGAKVAGLDAGEVRTALSLGSLALLSEVDADSVTVSNLETDNLKAGVLDTDLNSVSTSDDTLASAKAIKTYVDANAGGSLTLQQVTDNGATTTNNITLASSLPKLFFQDTDGTNQIAEISKAGTHLYFYNRDNASNGGYIFLGDNGTTDTEFMRIAADGNVEIGDNKKFKASTYSSSYIKFEDDTKVSANSDIIFDVNGSEELMRLEEGGKVGIGITAPSGNLHVRGSAVAGYVSDDYADLITESSDSRIQVVSDNGGNNGSAFILTNVNAGTHSNWAFGQTTTAQDNKLHIGHNTSAGGDVSHYSNSNDLTLTTDGKVGIGSFSPSFVLDTVFAGDNGARLRSTDNHSSLTVQSHASYGAYLRFSDGGNRYWLQARSDDKLQFRPNATLLESACIYFDETGRVGIGVSNPASALHVIGDGGTAARIENGALKIRYPANNDSITITPSVGNEARILAADVDTSSPHPLKIAGDYVRFTTSGSSPDTEVMRITADSKVGIGTTDPDTTLEVAGVIKSSSTSRVQADVLNNSANSANIIYRTDRTIVGNNASALVILDGGNVGIGTTNPQEELDLRGDMRLDSAGNTDRSIYFRNQSSIAKVRSDAALQFDVGVASSPTAAMYIEEDTRDVGIGLTSPTSKLHIYGGSSTGLAGSLRNDSKNRMNMKVPMSSTTRYIGTVTQYGNGDSAGFTIRLYDGAEKVFRIVRVVVQNSGGTNFPSITVEGGGEDTDIHIDLKYKNRDGDATKTDFFLDPTGTKFFTQYIEIEGFIFKEEGYNTTSLSSCSLDDNLALNILDHGNGSRVGVGTTDPSAKFHAEGSMIVKGDATWAGTDNQDGAIYMSDVGRGLLGNMGSNYARPLISTSSQTIIIGSNGTSAIRNIKYNAGNGAGTADSEHNFYTSGNNVRFHIAKDGKVGIGTDSPVYELDVAGDVGIDQYIRHNGDTNTYFGFSAGDTIQFNTASNERMRIAANGSVGIGVTNPAGDKLMTQADNGYFAARLNGSTTAGQSNGLRVRAGYNSTDRPVLVEKGDGTDVFIIDGLGNVGIGSAPSYELDVSGTTRSTFYIGGAYLEENASSSKLKFYTDGTVLVMDEDGELKPCEKENDTLVFGVSKKDFDSPVVLGAEPVLVTGPIKVGDYIVTSSKQGHGQAMKEQNIGTIIAQAMESGDGESYNIKAMIRKM